jgi:tetratricopeptide (TPR) repeat protein
LSEEELAAAIAAFGHTDDAMDRGIAEYLAGEYEAAEASLLEAAAAQESDYVETLRYLGATQYARGNYAAAVETFRKAVGLRGDDLSLMNWLGTSLHEVALWGESEEVHRRAVPFDIVAASG